MKRRQSVTHGATIAAHTLRGGDGGGGGASVNLQDKD
jgi:type IV secretion system protein TrbL